MLHLQHANVLRVAALAAVILSSPVSAAPSGISPLLGNTVDLTIKLETASLNFEEQHRFYFIRDGTRILYPVEPGIYERENEGNTYGLNEKLCMEHKRAGYDWQFIACGSFSVMRNLVTLNFDSKGWATGQAIADSAKTETVIAVDGPGKCRFVSKENFVTNDIGTNRLYSTGGTCRVLEGRHLNGPG